MPWLALHFLTAHKILYCSSSVNMPSHPQGNFSAGETSPTTQVLCLYSFPGHSHTVRMTMLCGALPHRASQVLLFSLTRPGRTPYPCSLHSHIQHAVAKAGQATLTFIIMGLLCQAHLVHSMEATVWGQIDSERSNAEGKMANHHLERPLARPHQHCPTLASPDWRLAIGETAELTDACSQWRAVTPGGGISSQVGGVSVSPQAVCQIACRQL